MPRFPDPFDQFGVVLGAAAETPCGVRGSVTARWFAGLAAGHVRPDDDAVRLFLEELDEAGER